MRYVVVATAALAAAVAGVVSLSAVAQDRSINVARGNLAVHGYDVVAYVTDGVAMRGRAEFEYRWNDAVWRFASSAHRDAFARDPQRYAPQFGGYCAWAVSRGYTADIDPDAWRIVDGKLYLNYSRRVQRMWEADLVGNIQKGEANWPGVLSR